MVRLYVHMLSKHVVSTCCMLDNILWWSTHHDVMICPHLRDLDPFRSNRINGNMSFGHVHVHIYMCTYMYIHIYTCIHTCAHMYVYAYRACKGLYTCMYTCTYTCVWCSAICPHMLTSHDGLPIMTSYHLIFGPHILCHHFMTCYLMSSYNTSSY